MLPPPPAAAVAAACRLPPGGCSTRRGRERQAAAALATGGGCLGGRRRPRRRLSRRRPQPPPPPPPRPPAAAAAAATCRLRLRSAKQHSKACFSYGQAFLNTSSGHRRPRSTPTLRAACVLRMQCGAHLRAERFETGEERRQDCEHQAACRLRLRWADPAEQPPAGWPPPPPVPAAAAAPAGRSCHSCRSRARR